MARDRRTARPDGRRSAVELRDTETPNFFWSVVSNVNMKLSSVPANYRRLLLSICENSEP